MEIRECRLEIMKRAPVKRLDISERSKVDTLVKLDIDETTAVMEAQRCLRIRRCESCGICVSFCPDSCITAGEGGHAIIDYRNCKGCGICAAICPRGAIEMILEEIE